MAEELGERVAKLEANRVNDRQFMSDLRDDVRQHLDTLHEKIDAVAEKIDDYEAARKLTKNCDKEDSINKLAWKRLFVLLGFACAAMIYGAWDFLRNRFG